MLDLDAAAAITLGGWDPRYAVVLRVATAGDVGAALVDTNGDGGDIDLDFCSRGPDGHWQSGSSSGGAGDSGTCWTPEAVAAYGRTTPFGPVQVSYDGRTTALAADADGWWLFVAPSVGEDAWPTTVEGAGVPW